MAELDFLGDATQPTAAETVWEQLKKRCDTDDLTLLQQVRLRWRGNHLILDTPHSFGQIAYRRIHNLLNEFETDIDFTWTWGEVLEVAGETD